MKYIIKQVRMDYINVIAGKQRLVGDSHSHAQFQAKREIFFNLWNL